MSKWKLNYPELGGVDSKRKFYAEGEVIEHPSGVKYIRKNGNWVIWEDPSKDEGSNKSS